MEKLNRIIRALFFVSLGLSVGFPLGILGIVFGATGGNVFLLVVGIVLTVAGFYVMPILWVRYAERRGDRTVFLMIEREYIYTVSGLAAQTGYDEKNIRDRLQRLIHSHILVGYLFVNDTLVSNTNEKQTQNAGGTKKCANCGAPLIFDGERYHCEYCLMGEVE